MTCFSIVLGMFTTINKYKTFYVIIKTVDSSYISCKVNNKSKSKKSLNIELNPAV